MEGAAGLLLRRMLQCISMLCGIRGVSRPSRPRDSDTIHYASPWQPVPSRWAPVSPLHQHVYPRTLDVVRPTLEAVSKLKR